MKKMFLLALAVALPVLCSAQDFEPRLKLTIGKNKGSGIVDNNDLHSFEAISDREAVWQKVYDSDVKTIHDLERIFFEHGFTDCKILNDSTLVCHYICHGGIPYQRYGYNRMKLPIFVPNVVYLKARVIAQLKEGRYRITFDNIYTRGRNDVIASGFTDFLVDESTGELVDNRNLNIILEVLDKFFSEAVDFSSCGYLSADF